MQNTQLLFMSEMWTTESEATVLEVLELEDKTILILDQTIFYAQGGGQPYDLGTIHSETGSFAVEEVRYMQGSIVVKHIGHFTNGQITAGQKVKLHVEPVRRALHSRLHSAGHVVDMALKRLGIEWKAVKGYHFPEGPYDEYEGTVPTDPNFKETLEKNCNQIIAEGAVTHLEFVSAEELQKRGFEVPATLASDKPLRIVYYGDFGIPCGGTHVAALADVQSMTIRKIKQEGTHVRVAYDVER